MNSIARTLWSKENLGIASALLLSVLMGFAAASGKPMVVALLGGVLAALALVANPALIFWLATLATLVIAGLVKYFVPTLDRIWWLAYGMAFLLYLPAMLHILNRKAARHDGSMLMSVCVGIFMTDLIIATLVAAPPIEQIVVAVKTLLMFGGMWAYFAFCNISSETVWKWLKLLLGIGIVQFVFALYQYVFVRATRLERIGTGRIVEASDSVVGTFGGSMDSGGLTAVLAFFLVSGIVMLIAMRYEKVLSRKQVWRYGLLLFFPLILMEVKVIFFYLPLAMLVLFRAEILRRPHVFITWACLGAITLVGMLLLYQTLHWSVKGGSLRGNVAHFFSYSFEEEASDRAASFGVMTRRETIEFWWKRHNRMEDLNEALLGHGIGASRTGGMVQGEQAQRYAPLEIDRTGIAHLLWDVGLIGTLAIIGALYAMYRQGGQLSRQAALLPWQRGLARGLQTIAPLYLLSLFYRSDIPYAAPMMFLFMSSFGLIAWLGKQAAAQPHRDSQRPLKT